MGLASRGRRYGQTIGDGELVVGTGAAVALSAVAGGIPAGTAGALITVGANAIRFRTSGLDPTSTVGHNAAAGAAIEVFLNDMLNFKAIAGTASTCFVSFLAEA
jgi:hypothetical protein